MYCLEEFPLKEALYKQESARADGAAVLSMNIYEGAEAVSSFMASNSYTMPVLLDRNFGTSLIYGVTGIPMTFFIDGDGVIRFIQRGAFSNQAAMQRELGKIR